MPEDGNFQTESGSIGCLAEYGGPAFPYVSLGGFRNGENDSVSDESLYMNATALVITFLINNKKDKMELGPAKDWEKAYESLKNVL